MQTLIQQLRESELFHRAPAVVCAVHHEGNLEHKSDGYHKFFQIFTRRCTDDFGINLAYQSENEQGCGSLAHDLVGNQRTSEHMRFVVEQVEQVGNARFGKRHDLFP